MQRAPLVCPSCERPLEMEERAGRLGKVKRTPSRCTHCGAGLLYTASGEVLLDPQRPPSGEREPSDA